MVVGIFGDKEVWVPRSQRALDSVLGQTAEPATIHLVYADTLAKARNQGAEEATGSHVVFLDADDELDDGYIEAMQASLDKHGPGHLHQPATLGISPAGKEDAKSVMIPSRDLSTGNYLVIGTMVERKLFLDVGGFPEFPAWEDFALWLRCVASGARVVKVPDAVYRVHVSPNGRNAQVAGNGKLFKEIKDAHRAWCSERRLPDGGKIYLP